MESGKKQNILMKDIVIKSKYQPKSDFICHEKKMKNKLKLSYKDIVQDFI